MASEKMYSIDSFEIPRPKFVGMQFVPIQGRYGYYQTVNKSVAIKYGLSQQQQQQRRPTLPNNWMALTERQNAAQRQMSADGLGTLERAPKTEERAEPTPDYDKEAGSDRIAVPNGRAPPAPPLPLSLILRQSLPGNYQQQRIGGRAQSAALRQESEKQRNSYEMMTSGAMNTFEGSTFREEPPKKSNKTKTVVDLRL